MSLALFSKASAAINVCAIPVGHAVTANTLYPLDCAFWASSLSLSAFNLSFSLESISDKNSSTLLAFINCSLNSGSISIIDNLANTSKWRLFSPSGAAIIKNNFAGSPSKES